jgi:hypothetical protein
MFFKVRLFRETSPAISAAIREYVATPIDRYFAGYRIYDWIQQELNLIYQNFRNLIDAAGKADAQKSKKE